MPSALAGESPRSSALAASLLVHATGALLVFQVLPSLAPPAAPATVIVDLVTAPVPPASDTPSPAPLRHTSVPPTPTRARRPAAVAPSPDRARAASTAEPAADPAPPRDPRPLASEAAPSAPRGAEPPTAASGDAVTGETPAVAVANGGRDATGPASPAFRGAGGTSDEGLTAFARPRGGYQLRPAYPETARRAGIEGVSVLRLLVRADGSIGDVFVERPAPHPDLDRAAIAAVRGWRFEPARRGREAVAVWVTLPVRFALHR
ncbi:MAG: TonB family protein [Candidatus Rokubacteria bacterium]|nr:TonB family protein [Candidatus Rokubacteria bacterium]